MKNIPVLIISVALLCITRHAAAQIDDRKVKNGVVKITDSQGETGTGIIIGYRERYVYILTARHVLQEQNISSDNPSSYLKTFDVQLYQSNETISGTFFKVSDKSDMGVLTVPIKDFYGYKFFKFRKAGKSPKLRTMVGTIGHPNGNDWKYYDANEVLESTNPKEIVITGEQIDQGNSGGPMVLRRNNRKLVGMIYTTSNAAANGIYVNEILPQLDAWGVPSNLVKRPLKTCTCVLGGAAIGAVLSGYYFNQEGVKAYDLYESYRDPDAAQEKLKKTREELLGNAKDNYTARNLLYIGSGVLATGAVLCQMGVFEKKIRNKTVKAPDDSGRKFYDSNGFSGKFEVTPFGLQYSLVYSF